MITSSLEVRDLATSLEHDIRSHLQAYVLGEPSLDALADWFLPATFSIRLKEDAQLVSLAGEIQLRLAELDAGHWTEPEFREQMHRILNAAVEYAIS